MKSNKENVSQHQYEQAGHARLRRTEADIGESAGMVADPREIKDPPKGFQRLKWLGPGFLWMVSASGSGELLFTPRIASMYGYSLIWALLLAVALKWFVNREIGRYSVCTGATFFSGIASLSPGSVRLLWLIVVPQLVVAVATISGLAGSASTALIAIAAGNFKLWVSLILICATAFITLGKYSAIEKAITILAVVITLAVLSAAISSQPDTEAMLQGMVPSALKATDYGEVLPWLGFMLAGAAGLMWFSYWVSAKQFGMAAGNEPVDPGRLNNVQIAKLKSWCRHMTIVNTLGVAGALMIALAFLVLGTELLHPKGLVPEENKIAETLGRLLGDIWGRTGYWFMIAAIFITFFSTILADQDGFSRMFTDGFLMLFKKKAGPGKSGLTKKVHRGFVIVVLFLLPLGVSLISGDPVFLLKVAGIIEACHIPFVAVFILRLNIRKLPKGLRPSTVSVAGTLAAAALFTAFAVVYLLQLFAGA